MDVDVAETSQTEVNGTFKRLSNKERKHLQAEGRCFRCKKQGHMSQDCPLKGKQPRKTVPFKRKARSAETAEGSADEDSDIADMEDVRLVTSDATKVSTMSKKMATSKIRTAQLTVPTVMSMFQRLTNEEKQEVFDGFLNKGF
jgi:hypothetical protein